MAGYSRNRETNYEIKYLRKVLGQVDNRIRVPQSVEASSLRALLDDIPVPVRETAKRARPRWLSLQSGIAYAAAFVLIVALFYSMELYRPEMIDGNIRIAASEKQSASTVAPPEIMANELTVADENSPMVAANAPEAAAPSAGTISDAVPSEFTQPANPPVEASSSQAQSPQSVSAQAQTGESLGIGGGGMATLLIEHNGFEYRARQNDTTDPDKAGSPVTLEVVSPVDGRLVTHMNYDNMSKILACLPIGERLVVVGTAIGDSPAGSDSPAVAITVYDNQNPESPEFLLSQIQSGVYNDAKTYKNNVHIVTMSEIPNGDVVDLPDASSDEYCIISALDTSRLRSYTRSYRGAQGTVQLHSLNAYIHYRGVAENGSAKDCLVQIWLEELDEELENVR